MLFVLFCGIIVGLILAKFSKEKFGISFDVVLEILIGGIIFGIIGGRAYFVLFKIDYYLANPSLILKIRDGGLAIYRGHYSSCCFCPNLLQNKKTTFFRFSRLFNSIFSSRAKFWKMG